ITTPTALLNGSRPAETKPMVAMVVALDDCTSAVMPAPAPTADQRLVVYFDRIDRNASPARALSPSVIRIMPRRNRPTPPIRLATIVYTRPPASIHAAWGRLSSMAATGKVTLH